MITLSSMYQRVGGQTTKQASTHIYIYIYIYIKHVIHHAHISIKFQGIVSQKVVSFQPVNKDKHEMRI